MKGLYLLLFSLLFSLPVQAADDTDQMGIIESAKDISQYLNSDYNSLLERVRRINPEIVEKIEKKAKTKDAQISMLRSYLARETFAYYKNKFLSDLKQRSQETGRKTENYKTTDFEEYWLNRGDLDKKKCRKDGWLICSYPDNFEEYYIKISQHQEKYSDQEKNMGTFNTAETISIEKDNFADGYQLDCTITLLHRSDEDFDTALLDVSCVMRDYLEIHEWRNNLVDDVLAGAFDTIAAENQPTDSPFGDTLYTTRISENPDEYKSTKFPGGHFISVDYTNNIIHQ